MEQFKKLTMSLIKQSDYIGIKPGLFINRSRRFSTIFGGLLCIILSLTMLMAFLYFSQDLVYYQYPNETKSTLYSDTPDIIKLSSNYSNFFIIVLIQNDKGDSLNPNYFRLSFEEIGEANCLNYQDEITEYMETNLELSSELTTLKDICTSDISDPFSGITTNEIVYNHNINTNFKIKTRNIQVQMCNSTTVEFLNDRYSKYDVANSICISDGEYATLLGNKYSSIYQKLKISLLSCFETECPADYQNYLLSNQNFKLTILLNGHIYDTKSYNDATYSYPDIISVSKLSTTTKKELVSLRNVLLKTDIGYILEDFRNEKLLVRQGTKMDIGHFSTSDFITTFNSFNTNGITPYYAMKNNLILDKSQVSIEFEVSPFTDVAYRKYIKVQKILAEVGGLFKCFVVMAVILNYFHNRAKYFQTLFRELFNTEDLMKYFQYFEPSLRKNFNRYRDSIVLKSAKYEELIKKQDKFNPNPGSNGVDGNPSRNSSLRLNKHDQKTNNKKKHNKFHQKSRSRGTENDKLPKTRVDESNNVSYLNNNNNNNIKDSNNRMNFKKDDKFRDSSDIYVKQTMLKKHNNTVVNKNNTISTQQNNNSFFQFNNSNKMSSLNKDGKTTEVARSEKQEINRTLTPKKLKSNSKEELNNSNFNNSNAHLINQKAPLVNLLNNNFPNITEQSQSVNKIDINSSQPQNNAINSFMSIVESSRNIQKQKKTKRMSHQLNTKEMKSNVDTNYGINFKSKSKNVDLKEVKEENLSNNNTNNNNTFNNINNNNLVQEAVNNENDYDNIHQINDNNNINDAKLQKQSKYLDNNTNEIPELKVKQSNSKNKIMVVDQKSSNEEVGLKFGSDYQVLKNNLKEKQEDVESNNFKIRSLQNQSSSLDEELILSQENQDNRLITDKEELYQNRESIDESDSQSSSSEETVENEEDIKQRQEEEAKNFYLETLKRDDKNKENFIKQREEKFHLTTWELFKFFCCTKDGETARKKNILFGGKDMIEERMDVVLIMKKMLEFDRFKNLMLNNNQLLLLDSLSKFMLDPERAKLVDIKDCSYEKFIDNFAEVYKKNDTVDVTLCNWVRKKYHLD